MASRPRNGGGGGGLTPQNSKILFKKSPYVRQNFGVRDVRGQVSKNIYQASYLLPSDFSNNFS